MLFISLLVVRCSSQRTARCWLVGAARRTFRLVMFARLLLLVAGSGVSDRWFLVGLRRF
jgi:hypothetical protein